MLTDHERESVAGVQIGSDCLIPVLLYHAVGVVEQGSDPLAVTSGQFESHLATIAESGRTPVTVTEIALGLRGLAPLPPRPVAITFDDAERNSVAAVESLAALGLRASVYAIAGDLETPAGLQRAEVEALVAIEGVELGAHSVNHPHLDELGTDAIRREVEESRARLEDLLGESPASFAYPFGSFDSRVRAVVMEAGFVSAAAVKNAISHREDDPFAIARWTVRATTGADQLARVLRGEGVPTAWSGERLRTRGYRTARRAMRNLRERGGR